MYTQNTRGTKNDGADSVWEEKHLLGGLNMDIETEMSENPTLRGLRTFPSEHLNSMKTCDLSPSVESSEPQSLPMDKENEEICSQIVTTFPESSAPDFEVEPIYPSTYDTVMIMISVTVMLFLFSIDRTIITVAIPQITDEFKSLSDSGWYGTAYILAAAVLGPTWGKAYSVFSIKHVFILVVTLFLAGSAIVAAAQSSFMFIIGRIIAGIGSGGILCGVFTIIAHMLPLHRRAIFTAAMSSIFGIASLIGPLVGGFFTEKLSWRWCFLINLPLGAIAIIGITYYLQLHEFGKTRRKTIKQRLEEFDYIGPALLIPAVILLFLALEWGGTEYPWNSPLIIAFLSGFIMLFPVWLYSQIWLGEKAMTPPRLLINPTVLIPSLFTFFVTASYNILIYYLPLYFQAIRNLGAGASAINTLSLIFAVVLVSLISGMFLTRIGYCIPFMIAGAVLLAIGAGLISTFETNTSAAYWISYEIIAGIGVGLWMPAPILMIQCVDISDISIANAVFLIIQQFGPAIFLAAAQTLFLGQLIPKFRSINPDITETDVIRTGATGLLELFSPSEIPNALNAYSESLDSVFIMAAVLSLVAAATALGIKWKCIKGPKDIEDIQYLSPAVEGRREEYEYMKL